MFFSLNFLFWSFYRSSPVAPALPPTSSTLKTPTHPIRWWSKHGGKKDSHPAVAQALLPAGGHLHVSSIWALPCSCNPLSPAAAVVPCLALSVCTAQAIHCLHTRPFDNATLKQITLTSTKPFTSATKGVAISFCWCSCKSHATYVLNLMLYSC